MPPCLPRRKNTPAGRTPRTISPSAAPPRKVRPNTRPDAPRPKTRAPAHTGEGRVSRLSVSFLPLKMAAAHNRKNRAARSPKQQRAAVRPSHRCAKSCQPHAAPCRPACRAAKNAWASRHAGRTAPPRHENSPVSRTPHAAPPSPRPSHFRAQSGQPHKNWAAPDRTHRPSPAIKTIRQQRPHPKARAPARTGGGRVPCLSVSFLPPA